MEQVPASFLLYLKNLSKLGRNLKKVNWQLLYRHELFKAVAKGEQKLLIVVYTGISFKKCSPFSFDRE